MDAESVWYSCTAERFHARFVSKKKWFMTHEKSPLSIAVFVDNSMVGQFRFRIRFGMYRHACTNGLIFGLNDFVIVREFHKGKKDYQQIVANIKLEHLKSLNRTDEGYVLFGIGNRKWIILDEEKGLLFSKDTVCLHCFDATCNNYERSEIRQYLNDELLNELFTTEEQQMIVDTVIDGEESYRDSSKRSVSKSVLVIDTPKKCSMCEFMKKTDERYCFCGILGFDFQVNEYPSAPNGKLDCCPLKEMPQKYANISMDYERGYNACIEEILKS